MPNPYDDFLFGDDEKKKKQYLDDESKPLDLSRAYEPPINHKEPLDEILERNKIFQKKAESFSRILSEASAVDHKVLNNFTQIFLLAENKNARLDLPGEKEYYAFLNNAFESIIVPMRELAEIHQASVLQFNEDIDNDYYSLDKIEKEVEQEIALAIEGIQMQRKILSEASKDLEIFKDALIDTEKRIKTFIGSGGENNISNSEVLILISKREEMTSGNKHRFDYGFFEMNLLDKAATSVGWYMKETTSQYLNKLMSVLY